MVKSSEENKQAQFRRITGGGDKLRPGAGPWCLLEPWGGSRWAGLADWQAIPELLLCERLAPRKALAGNNENDAEAGPRFHRPRVLVWRDRQHMSERMGHSVPAAANCLGDSKKDTAKWDEETQVWGDGCFKSLSQTASLVR